MLSRAKEAVNEDKLKLKIGKVINICANIIRYNQHPKAESI